MTHEQVRSSEVIAFLDNWIVPHEEQKKQWEHSYQTWGKHARRWNRISGMGGTYQLKAIRWYQHVHKPGSVVSRPDLVLGAIHEAIDTKEAK